MSCPLENAISWSQIRLISYSSMFTEYYSAMPCSILHSMLGWQTGLQRRKLETSFMPWWDWVFWHFSTEHIKVCLWILWFQAMWSIKVKNKLNSYLQRGWVARAPARLHIQGSWVSTLFWPLAGVVLGNPEFNSCPVCELSQVVCLQPVWIFKQVLTSSEYVSRKHQ